MIDLQLPTANSSHIAEVLAAGLETTVQDYGGRRGYLQLGIPRSGPMDRNSFRLGNQLLSNPESAAGLEIQFIGPTLRFFRETVIAITGADNNPQINQKPIPLWSTTLVQPGDILSFEHAKYGARTYIHFAGGLDVPVVMGSRSTFLRGELGGLEGRKLAAVDRLSTCPHFLPIKDLLGRSLPKRAAPKFSNYWEVEVLIGPHDDWLTAEDIDQFLTVDWQVSAKSDRVGYRLEGPSFQFSTNAHKKAPDNGSHPSNKIDYGCATGAILFCGQTPTILMADSPSLTGYMTPFTVIEASLSKVGQARPGDKLTFKLVDLNTAIQKRQVAAVGGN
ncbi:MAG: biotin-dependent carboxyltransferase family protein [Pseudanabaenales cyanobacterium]|nr:biotin-dependent carboxyltransferase family protein [Pseudanabaenales cyanobacterium]